MRFTKSQMKTIEVLAPHTILCNPFESVKVNILAPPTVKGAVLFVMNRDLFPLFCPNGFIEMVTPHFELTLCNFSLPYSLMRPKSSMEMMVGDRNRVVLSVGEKLGNLIILDYES